MERGVGLSSPSVDLVFPCIFAGAETQFQYEDVVGDLSLEQADPGSPLTIKGQITGVEVPGAHAFRVTNGSLETGNCSTIFEVSYLEGDISIST